MLLDECVSLPKRPWEDDDGLDADALLYLGSLWKYAEEVGDPGGVVVGPAPPAVDLH